MAGKKIKYVYAFGAGKAEGSATMKNLLGGKGANLAEMNRIGIPVPAGFTISTEVCTYYYEKRSKIPSTASQRCRSPHEKSGKSHGRQVRRPR